MFSGIAKLGNGIEIVRMLEDYGYDYYVYKDENLVRVCPSEGMAREVIAGL